MNVSTSTPNTKTIPIWLEQTIVSNNNPLNDIAITTPAALMIGPVLDTPNMMAAFVVYPRHRYSYTREYKNISSPTPIPH